MKGEGLASCLEYFNGRSSHFLRILPASLECAYRWQGLCSFNQYGEFNTTYSTLFTGRALALTLLFLSG